MNIKNSEKLSSQDIGILVIIITTILAEAWVLKSSNLKVPSFLLVILAWTFLSIFALIYSPIQKPFAQRDIITKAHNNLTLIGFLASMPMIILIGIGYFIREICFWILDLIGKIASKLSEIFYKK